MSPVAMLTALCALVGLLCILRRPQYAVVLMLVMFPLEQLLQSYFSVLLEHPTIINIIVGLMAALALGTRFASGERMSTGYGNGVTACVWGLYFVAWIGLAQTPMPREVMTYMLPGIPYYLLTLVVLPFLISDTESFRRILLGFMVAGTAICLLILVNPNASFYGGRLSIDLGPFSAEGRGNPLAIADLGGQISLVALLYRPRRAGLLMVVMRVAVVLIGLGLAIHSGSRGQVLVSIGAALVFFPVARRATNVKQIVAAVIGLAFMGLLFRFLFTTFITADNEARWGADAWASGFDDRIALATRLLQEWVNSPGRWPLGLGTNFFLSLNTGNIYVHNLILEVMCEEGFLGLGLLVGALWFTFDAGRKLLALTPDFERRAAVATLCALCTYNFVLSLKQGSFIASPGLFMGWFLLAKISKTEQMRAAEAAAELEALQEQEADEADGGGGLAGRRRQPALG